jgi:hypothetical protein
MAHNFDSSFPEQWILMLAALQNIRFKNWVRSVGWYLLRDIIKHIQR